MLVDSKRDGQVLARMKGDLLKFEKPRLDHEAYDGIVMTAISMAEAARRQKRKSDIADIGCAIGGLSSSNGGTGSDAGGNEGHGRVS